MPVASPTTVLVAASMKCTLSPALLVWTIRTRAPLARIGAVSATQASAIETSASDRMRGVMGRVSLLPSIHSISTRRAGAGLAPHPGGEGLVLRVVLRGELAAAIVELVAASGRLERMAQEAALHRVARRHELRHTLEVLARLLLVPRGCARRQRLQKPDRALGAVAHDAARESWTFREKYGLDLRLEVLEVERGRRGRLRGGRLRNPRSRRGQEGNNDREGDPHRRPSTGRARHGMSGP